VVFVVGDRVFNSAFGKMCLDWGGLVTVVALTFFEILLCSIVLGPS
jgi:hypothetical protein